MKVFTSNKGNVCSTCSRVMHVRLLKLFMSFIRDCTEPVNKLYFGNPLEFFFKLFKRFLEVSTNKGFVNVYKLFAWFSEILVSFGIIINGNLADLLIFYVKHYV